MKEPKAGGRGVGGASGLVFTRKKTRAENKKVREKASEQS